MPRLFKPEWRGFNWEWIQLHDTPVYYLFYTFTPKREYTRRYNNTMDGKVLADMKLYPLRVFVVFILNDEIRKIKK